MPINIRKVFFGAIKLHRPLTLVWESARSWTFVSMVLIVLHAILPLAVLYLIKLTVDAVAAGIVAVDKTAALQEVLLLVLLTGLVTLLIAALRSASTIVEEHQAYLVTDHVTDVIQRQSAVIDLACYEDSRYHNTFYRAQREATTRPLRIVRELTNLFQSSISLIALAGLLIFLHWGAALVLFLAALPAIIVKVRHSSRLFKWHARRTETERRANDYHKMMTDVDYAKELRLFNLGDFFRQRYRELRAVIRGERLDLAKARSKADLMAQTVTVISLFLMVAYIAWQTIEGNMTLGDMVMYQQAFQRSQAAMQGIVVGLAGLYEHNLFLNQFYGFLDLKPQIATPANPISPPRPMRKGIEIKSVSFKYPLSEKAALKGIDLEIGPGEIVALVGDNGAGKTTLAKLICRLYDPEDGEILFDGIKYPLLDLQALRREISMIFQDYVHYPLTARENIWIGDILSDPGSSRIGRAARQAGAEGIIKNLANGYETILGKSFDKGDEISIGEWQKIALSRAFIRDAQLIVLDEPTSSISVKSEFEVFQTFRELLNGRSALLISHRFSTVSMADMICVMENGCIVERGSHEELVRSGGRYSRLYEMQAQYFR